MIIKSNTAGHPLPDPRKGLNMQGGINMNGNKLSGLPVPIEDNEAAPWGLTGRYLFKNTLVSANLFFEDETYSDFPYRAMIELDTAQDSMIPEIIFSLADATSGNFAPVAESYNGGIYIYASEVPETDVTIPVIILWKGNAV